MKFDRYAGLASVVGIVLVWVMIVWLGVGGPIWRAYWTASPEQWLGFAGNVLGGAMTLLAAGSAWFAVQSEISANRSIAGMGEREAWEIIKEDLERSISGINLYWRSIDHALEKAADDKAQMSRYSTVLACAEYLPDNIQIDSYRMAAKDLGARRQRRISSVLFVLTELKNSVTYYGQGPAHPEENFKPKQLGRIRLLLTIFEKNVRRLDPALCTPLTCRVRSDSDDTSVERRHDQIWSDIVRLKAVAVGRRIGG
jgi:hypothetical protein